MSTPAWIARWAAGDPQLSALFVAPPYNPMSVVAKRPVGAWQALSVAELDEWRAFLESHGATEATIAAMHALGEARALTVVTGQQAGFAMGPLYVIYKALTAIHFARRVEQESGRPCVPIFWVASDDHDIDEVAELHWADDSGRLRKDRAESAASALAPAYEATISDGEVARVIHAMAADLPEESRALFADGILAASAAPTTFESQFVRHFLDLFGELGIVPIVPRLGFLRARASGLVEQEIARPRASSVALAGENARLRDAFGFETIHRTGDELNFFMECGERGTTRRCKLSWEGASIVMQDPIDGTRVMTPEELLTILRDDTGRFSPNAAMRPLVQDLSLPTVAYIGGPAECAYHAQIAPLYDAFGLTRPAIIPRASGVLLEKQAVRSLAKLGVDPSAAAAASRDQLEAMLRGDTEGALPELSPMLESALRTWAQRLGEEATDPQVSQGLSKTRENILFAAKKLEERAATARARREGTRESHARRVVDSMFPGGEPQERTVNAHFALSKLGGAAALESISAALVYDSPHTQPIAL